MKGRLTLPTDLDIIEETIALKEELGADAIRDCDGTQLPDEIKNLDAKIYSTYYTTRKDNAWAQAHPEEIQQEYVMSERVCAKGKVCRIECMKHYSKQQFKINIHDDIYRWWEVIDRTSGEVVPVEHWHYEQASDEVVIEPAIPYHEYTVSFLVYLIWDPVHMYNSLTNDWKDEPHQCTYDVRQPKTKAYVKEKLKHYCEANPDIDVIRFTTFFHQFTLQFNEYNKEKMVEWFGYSASVSPYILEQFEKWAGYRFRPEYIIDEGYHNSTFRIPSPQFKDFMEFQQIEVCALAKELVDIVHSYGKEAMMFLGDHWIGTEPFGKYFASIGLDAVVGSVGNGVTLRMISDIQGVSYTEGRLLPYFFPDVFCEGGKPIEEALENWAQARRAILRSPLDRIGYGGYLKLAIEQEGFINEIKKIVNEFRTIHEFSDGERAYTAPFKVAILNAWGELRRWMSNQVSHALWFREIYSYVGVIECLSGMPFDVKFISFEDVKKGIDSDIKVIINAGDAYTAWSGGAYWKDASIVAKLREFVDNGGGFIGVGEPSAYQFQGAYFQLSDVMGVDKELGYSLITDKYNTADPHHFILEEIDEELDFGEGMDRIYAYGDHYQILDQHKGYARLVVNDYGKGRSVYFAGLPYSPQNCRLLMRAIYYAAHEQEALHAAYLTNKNCELAYYPKHRRCIVINNAKEACECELLIDGKIVERLIMEPKEMRCIQL